jgi:hypothetical protein
MSLDGTSYTFIPYTINGINPVSGSINTTNFVKYSGNTSNTDLDGFDLTTSGTISAQNFAIPDNNSNDESWITYSISTMGNLSTVGGLITTDLTNGRSMYFTGGVLGAPNFQFATLGNGGKVVATDDNGVMSTTIGVGQLNYITALTSQAGGVGQNNTWTGTNDFQTLTSVGALRITSSIANEDFSISVNAINQLELKNIITGNAIKTGGDSMDVPLHINAGGFITCSQTRVFDTNYLHYGDVDEWRQTIPFGSPDFEIQDDAGLMQLRLSKTTGLTVSTMNITNVPSLTPSLALGLNGGGQVVSFAVPAAVNLLPLNNVWTGTNQFNNRVLLNTATAQGSLTVYNTTDSLPGGGSGSALAVFSATSTDSAIIFGCSANTTFAIRSSGSLANPTLALYSPTVAGMLTFTQNEATMTHGGNSFSLGNTRFLTSTVDSGVSSASVLAVSPTTISNASGTYTALANSTTIEWRMRILADWIGGINYTLTMVNTNWSSVKTPIQITVQSPLGTTIGSTNPTLGGTSQVLFTYPQGANGNIYIYIYYVPLGATPTFTWTTLSVVANVLRSNLYSTKTAMAVNTTVPSFAGLALQSITAPNGSGNATTIENFVVGDVSAGTPYPKGYQIGFNAGNLATTITCQQASAGAGTTFYDLNSSAAYHSWKSRPNTANSVDMVLDYNAGNGGLRLNKNGASRTTTALLDVNGTVAITGDTAISGSKFIATGTIAGINGGSAFAIPNNYMSSGSLTIGDNTKNYGGGGSWNTNTAGFLMECLDNTEIAVHDAGTRVASFMYYSGNTFTMGRDMGWGGSNLSMPGIVSITGALTFGYSRYLYSPETAGATYGSMCVKGTGRNAWAGYSIYNDSNQQASFMMNNTAQSHGIYNATAGIWSLYVDVPNGCTYLQSAVGSTPISFGPGSWSSGGGGYTLITRALGNNTSALAFGTSPNRGVIISLTAGIVWNELILSAGYIYTSCFGTVNNYTNGGGWVYVSDKRCKKDIKDIKTARSLERIMALKPKTYKKIYNPEKSATPIPKEAEEANHVGFLAQDVMETNPHCVSEWTDENSICDGDDGKRLGISYGDINVHLVGAVQELKKQNDAQQKEIDELKEMVKALMAKLK